MAKPRRFRTLCALWATVTLLAVGCGSEKQGGDGGASPKLPLTHVCAEAAAELARDPRVEMAREILQARTPVPYEIELQGVDETTGAYHVAFGFTYDGIPICSHRVRVHLLSDGSHTMTGLVPPAVDIPGFHLLEPPPLSANFLLSGEDKHVLSEILCLRPTKGRLETVRRVNFLDRSRPMTAWLTSAGIESIESVSFHAVEEKETVGRIASSEGVIEVPLADIDDSGYLRNPRLRAFAPESYPSAYAPDGRFLYQQGDPRFAQVTAFVHAERTIEWFSKPEHAGSLECLPIELYLHDQHFRGRNNNAEYIPPPGSPTGRAQVRIADGDGRILQNLALSPDVVAHELGHHVIYKSLQSTRADSVLVHEGLADFLQAAQAGDPCLGESICPADSEVCYVRGRCLRTADNDLKLTSPEYAELDIHRRSQVLSGLLWELAQDHLGLAYVTQAVFTAILYLPLEATLRDPINALLAADKELAGGANRCTILTAAKGRGFDVEACE